MNFQKASEEELLQAIAYEETREAAFEEIVRRHYRQVKGWVERWVQNPDTAEELTQEVFLTAWKNLHKFRGEARISTWLYTIARRKTFSFIKKDSTRSWLPWPASEEGEIWEPAAEADVPYERLFRELEVARTRLTPIQQRIYQAVWQEGRRYKDIASEMGLKTSTIKAHVFHIRRQLWKYLRAWLGDE